MFKTTKKTYISRTIFPGNIVFRASLMLTRATSEDEITPPKTHVSPRTHTIQTYTVFPAGEIVSRNSILGVSHIYQVSVKSLKKNVKTVNIKNLVTIGQRPTKPAIHTGPLTNQNQPTIR